MCKVSKNLLPIYPFSKKKKKTWKIALPKLGSKPRKREAWASENRIFTTDNRHGKFPR